MIHLKRHHYPLSYLLGLLHLLTICTQYKKEFVTLQMITLFLKSHYEGFRVNIFFYLISIILWISGLDLLSEIVDFCFLYFAYRLINYELPSGGDPVGHLYIKGGWLTKYDKIPEMAVYYPADKVDVKNRKIGMKWLKVMDYAKRMDDTAKKDVRRKRSVPKLFFQVICTQFYKFIMYVYEGAKIDINCGEQVGGETKFQVIILSHGLASHCDGYSVVARYLAQQGIIVFVPEHVENIRNIYWENEDNRIYRQDQLRDRFATLQQVLDIIYDLDRFSSLFPVQNTKIIPDFKEISVIGHSFGGSAALEVTNKDTRITGACILYDPCVYVFPDNEKIKLHVPFISINADDFYNRLYRFMDNDARIEKIFQQIEGPIQDHCVNVYIKDQQHADFSDIPIIWNGEAGLYSVSKNVHEVHLRFGIILWLTKLFLAESKKYHELKNTKHESHGNHELKELIQRQIQEKFGQSAKELIRWQLKSEE